MMAAVLLQEKTVMRCGRIEKNEKLWEETFHHREGTLQYNECRGHGRLVCGGDK